MPNKLTFWEERIANDPTPRSEMTLMLSDWRSEQGELLKKLERIQAFHKEDIQNYVPRTRSYTIHESIINFTGTLILAISCENLGLIKDV